jgi:hypothetical protein
MFVKMHGSVHSLDEAAAVGVFDESFGDLACASLSSDSSSLGGRLPSATFPRLLVIYIVVSQAKDSVLDLYSPIREHHRRGRGRNQ